jgi:hypothetical protein
MKALGGRGILAGLLLTEATVLSSTGELGDEADVPVGEDVTAAVLVKTGS